jgi:DMSO/TMAO reductase YedYZ molybdopterin-dependent catalytic subunit
MPLPPGQREIAGFPRFGAHGAHPPPQVPVDSAIALDGAALREPVRVPLAVLAGLSRREQTADFHCVAGWSAVGLRWEGVAFATFYAEVVAPALRDGATVTHAVFEGLDGYRSIVEIDDALADDVLLAEHLDGAPLSGDHGAPIRLVSPSQYGFISTKHLCRIELHTAPPPERYHPSWLTQLGLDLTKPHRRARVWHEERHRYLPARLLRPIYRLLIAPIKRQSERGGG